MFENANRNVTRYTARKETEMTRITEGAAKRMHIASERVRENHDRVDREVAVIESANRQKEIDNIVLEAKMFQAKLPAYRTNVYNRGRELVFNHIMTEAFKNALVLDEYFVTQQSENLASLMEGYIAEKGGYGYLTDSEKRTKSMIMGQLITACESVAKVVTERMVKEAEETKNLSNLDFRLTEDEEKQLDYKTADISLDLISNIVKGKVLTVVQEEKERQKREEELQTDLEAQAEEDGTTVEEAAMRYIVKRNPNAVQETTLFNSMAQHSMKVMLEAASYTDPDTVNPTAGPDDYVNTTSSDMTQNEFKPYTNKDMESSEYSRDKEESQYKSDSDAVLNDDAMSIDMDLVLAESITRYTLLEFMHTLKFETFTGTELRKIIQKSAVR